ncbi:putative response regulator receiver domain protein [Actinoplanes missouriensis 431]|uniref:Putative response regulator receiver domain protein n=1 Tax=Actinoplanes missouriensis (strain ATCC 14538 / DSM 43046 / CBS 188.64 / JCM 3121 / NBRC 102363 / NCIMB 12654 / NRRL B-3342 / UNCC 431) TaxID=512565 RepID=I0H454_ACTM4|nr:putative response regulator receiver domain protein [Actinoplanes missouriensis 431]
MVTLRCLLVDDNRHFLAAARELLEREGLVVVGAATHITEAIGQAAALAPDVALVDIKLGAESGFQLARQLSVTPRPTPVIMISTHAGDDYADLVASSPAIGFLDKASLSARAVRELLSTV